MNLSAVRWPEALDALERRHARLRDAASRRVLAEALSLSARFEADYAVASRRVARARELEPFDALHARRAALHELRFGRWQEALALVDALDERLPGSPLCALARALALLASGEPRRAMNVAASHLETAAPSAPGRAPLRYAELGAFARGQFKGAEARLDRLARADGDAPLMAEALLVLLASHPSQAAAAVQRRVDQGALPKGSRAEALVRDALAWSRAEPERAPRELSPVEPGTRREEAALLFLTSGDGWRSLTAEERARRLRSLHRTLPERAAVRRLYASALTRLAVERFGREDYAGALQAVQLCLELEPHDAVHHQNRAAVFTALGDHDAYHDAWASLDRHHYRLALLGVGDVEAARRALRPHRMFAQQARLTPREPGRPVPEHGVLREDVQRDEGAPPRTVLRVNQSRVESDPEQLRQWVHHRRAELFFAHAALGGPLARVLLWPDDPALGRKRLDGLAACGASLAVLVPGEGDGLVRAWTGAWQGGLAGLLPRYGAAPKDEAAAQLAAQHLETLGDLALLAFQLKPPPERPDVTHELVDFALAEMPFFDERALYAVLDDREREPPLGARMLHHVLMLRRGGDDDRPRLTEAQREGVARWLGAQLLVSLALAQVGDGGRFTAGSVERALASLARARSVDPESAAVELHAARLHLVSQRDDEARAALGRFHRLARDGEEALRREAEEVKRVLDQRRGRGEARAPSAPAGAPDAPAREGPVGRQDLEREIERFPSSVAAYESLARHLAADGRHDEAVECAERAVSRCLTREGQLRARALHVEALGLRHLGAAHANAARLYLAGSRDALRAAIEAGAESSRPYPVDYLLGACHLAAMRRADARAAFARAVERCERAMHLAVLRPLAEDVDAAMVNHAAASLSDAAAGGRFADAFRELAALWASCERREACLVELARLHHLAVAASPASRHAAADAGAFEADAPWGPRLRAALAEGDPLDRVEALCELAAEAHPPSRPRAEAIQRKARALRGQVRLAGVVRDAAEHVQAGRLEEALAALEAARAEGAAEPRWLRMLAVVLLRLERFDEADRAVAELRGARDPEAVELVERYPDLAFRGRVAAATRRVRAGDLEAAAEALSGAVAEGREQRLELTFCKAFRLALVARRHEAGGARREATRSLLEALDELEPRLGEAREAGHRRLLDLHAQVERDLAAREGGRR